MAGEAVEQHTPVGRGGEDGRLGRGPRQLSHDVRPSPVAPQHHAGIRRTGAAGTDRCHGATRRSAGSRAPYGYWCAGVQ